MWEHVNGAFHGFGTSPIISHERKQVVIQFIIGAGGSQMYRTEQCDVSVRWYAAFKHML